MNRQEAYSVMKKGYKVTHTSFTSSEFLHFVGEQVFTEDNYYFEDKFFEREWFENGWSVYEESQIVLTTLTTSDIFNNIVFEATALALHQPKPWYNQFGYKRQIYKSK